MIEYLLLSAAFLTAIAVFAFAIQQHMDIRDMRLRIAVLKSEVGEVTFHDVDK